MAELDGGAAEIRSLARHRSGGFAKLAALAESANLVRSPLTRSCMRLYPIGCCGSARRGGLSDPGAQVLPFERGWERGGTPGLRGAGMERVASSRLPPGLLSVVVSLISASPRLALGGIGGSSRSGDGRRAQRLARTAAGYFSFSQRRRRRHDRFVPATGDSRRRCKDQPEFAQEVRLPEPKPWGLMNFRGARPRPLQGRPAAAVGYTTDNKAIGPLTLISGPRRNRAHPPWLADRTSNLLTGGIRAAPRTSGQSDVAISGECERCRLAARRDMRQWRSFLRIGVPAADFSPATTAANISWTVLAASGMIFCAASCS